VINNNKPFWQRVLIFQFYRSEWRRSFRRRRLPQPRPRTWGWRRSSWSLARFAWFLPSTKTQFIMNLPRSYVYNKNLLPEWFEKLLLSFIKGMPLILLECFSINLFLIYKKPYELFLKLINFLYAYRFRNNWHFIAYSKCNF